MSEFEHYYTQNPTSALRFYEINTTLRGFKLKLTTSSGVFSPKRVDRATKLLIENMKVVKDEDFLDLGCGYGIIGVVAAKLGANVTMTDVNERAIMLARKNIKNNKVSARAISKINGKFNNICLNPPIAAGMKVCKKLIKDSFNMLKKNGILQLVARHNKGGSRLESFMKELFSRVETVAKKGGFRVYIGINQ